MPIKLANLSVGLTSGYAGERASRLGRLQIETVSIACPGPFSAGGRLGPEAKEGLASPQCPHLVAVRMMSAGLGPRNRGAVTDRLSQVVARPGANS